MMVLGIAIGLMAVVTLVGALARATYFSSKKNSIKAYGQLVDLPEGRMHVYSMGAGSETIVLLPGLAMTLPSAEFSPLMRALSKEHRVVCVEYFGVGFSGQTLSARTCENYVEETRSALRLAGFNPPYVLMPHSISSVYSEYYAAKYPSELRAIISLDGTTSAEFEEMPAFLKAVFPLLKFQQSLGTSALLAPLISNRKRLSAQGYSDKEISDMIAFAGFVINDNVVEQMANTVEFIKAANALPYPASVPYMKIISRQTYETPNPQLKTTPQEYQRRHLERIGTQARYEILEGNHFIFLNNAENIAAIVRKFL